MEKPKLRNRYGISTNETMLSELADLHSRVSLVIRQLEENNKRIYAMQKTINDLRVTVSWHDEKLDDLRKYCDHLAGK